MLWIEEYGYIGLFLFCLLAATIIPVSSESAFIAAIIAKLNIKLVLFWATFGNCSGTFINYLTGWWIGEKWINKKISKTSGRAYSISKKYGWTTLFLSWLPVIGDPVTIIAGVLRWNIVTFIIIVFTLRFLRYYVILEIFIYGNMIK